MKFIFVGICMLIYVFQFANSNPDLLRVISELRTLNVSTTTSPEALQRAVFLKSQRRCKRACKRNAVGRFRGRCSDPGRIKKLCLYCRYTFRCGVNGVSPT